MNLETEISDFLEWQKYYLNERAVFLKCHIYNDMMRRMMLKYPFQMAAYPKTTPLPFKEWKIKKYRGSKALAQYLFHPEEFYQS